MSDDRNTDVYIDFNVDTTINQDPKRVISKERMYKKTFPPIIYSTENDSEAERMELERDIEPGDFEKRLEEALRVYPQYEAIFDYDHNFVESLVPRKVIQEIPKMESKISYVESMTDYYHGEFVFVDPEPSIYNSKVSLKERIDLCGLEGEPDVVVESSENEYKIDEGYIGSIDDIYAEIKAKRTPLYLPGVIKPEPASGVPIDQRLIGEPLTITKQYNNEFIVEFKQIDFAFSSKEPIYAAISLYDIEKMEKISETFFLEYNQENDYLMAIIISFAELDFDPETNIRKVIFSSYERNPNIYMVIRLVRVFGVDLENNCDIYTKGEKFNEKDRLKFGKDIGLCISKYGRYRQAFAWSAVQIYDENGNFILKDQDIQLPISRQDKYLSDETLFEVIKKTNSKVLDGFILLHAKEVTPNMFFENLVDSSYFKISDVEPQMDNDLVVVEDLVRRIADFSTEEETPNANFVNNLYVYPTGLSTLKVPNFKVKHILLRCFVLEDDSEPFAYSTLAKDIIFGKSCSKNFVQYYDQTVDVNNKHPEFMDEIKIKLPIDVSRRLHLLFVYYNIDDKAHKKGIQDIQEIESLMGYSVLRISDTDKCIIQDGVHRRQFYTPPELVPGYLDTLEVLPNPEAKPFGVLTMRTKLESSVLFQDPHLNQFFRIDTTDTELIYNWITNVKEKDIQHSFHHILNRLLMFLTKTNETRLIFEAIVSVLEKIDKLKNPEWGLIEKNPYIESYLNYHLQLPDSPNLHSILTREWIAFLNDKQMVSQYHDTTNYFANYLYTIITKSMKNQIIIKPDTPRKERFPRMKQMLPQLVSVLLSTIKNTDIQPDTIREFSAFVSDLIYFMDRTVMMNIVHHFMSKLRTNDVNNTLKRKMEFLRALSDHEYYVALILPLPGEVNSTKSLTRKFWYDYFIPGHILQEVRKSVYDEGLSSLSIEVTRSVLWKHAIDSRLYNNREFTSLVASTYFPLIICEIDNFRQIQICIPSDKFKWIQSLTWILKHTDKKIMSQWWSLETVENCETFLLLLLMIMPEYRKHAPELTGEIGVTLIDIIQQFCNDLEMKLWDEKNIKTFQYIIDIYNDIFSVQKVNTLDSALLSFKTFASRFSGPLFRFKSSPQFSSLCGKLYKIILDNPEIKEKAISVIVTCFLFNYLEMNEVNRMQLISTINVFKFVDHKNIDNMDYVFDSIISYLKAAHSQHEPLIKELMTLFNRLRRFIDISNTIERISDPEMKAEKLYEFANQSAFSCELRIKMLERLSNYHESLSNFEEVAQCKLIVAGMISYYMREANPYYPSLDDLSFISPNILLEDQLTSIEALENEDPPEIFNKKGYENVMNEIVDAFAQSNDYEVGSESILFLVNLYKTIGDYNKLSKQLTKLSNYAKKAVEISKQKIFSNFFRVGFYGLKFGELNGMEFIYKQAPTIRLSDFRERMEAQFTDKIGEKVEMLPNKHPDQLDIKPDHHYLQIIITDPIADVNRNRLATSGADWENSFGVKHFTVQFPYNPDGGKLSEDVDKQWIIRQTYETEKSFPSLNTRIQIIGETQILLGPLECAIDLISSRVNELAEEVGRTPPNSKTLQIKLQGSVMLQVNAGPKAIAHYFLKNDSLGDWEPEKIDLLRTSLSEFIKQVRFGLMLNERLIVQDESLSKLKEHQLAMVDAYNDFVSEIEPYGISGSKMNSLHAPFVN